jgi:hypothetical protein
MQTAAVDDAHAAVAGVAAVVEEAERSHARLGCGHAMQIDPVTRDVIPSLQLSELTPIYARCGEGVG